MNEFIMILGMVVVTFSIRYILFALADQFRIAPPDGEGPSTMFPPPF